MTTGASGSHPEGTGNIRVDVVIPVLNEVRQLEHSVKHVREFLSHAIPYRWRVVVADNGSSDGTKELGERLAATHPDEVEFLRLEQRGRGRALHRAWLQSQADIVCYMDVDLSTQLDALPPALRAVVNDGCDIVIGSCLMPESKIRRGLKREIISRIYNLLLRAALQVHFRDAQAALRWSREKWSRTS